MELPKKISNYKLTISKLIEHCSLNIDHSKKGFTLIELLVAISIIAIISTIGLVSYSQSQLVARDARRKQDLRALKTAIELFYQTNKRFPCSGAGWAYSGQTSWLTDSNLAGCTGGTNINIAPNFINSVPSDPKTNTTTPQSTGGYGYYSPNTTFGSGASQCPQGSYYIFVTVLENTSDPERLNNGSKTLCGETLNYTGTSPLNFSQNSFVITSE